MTAHILLVAAALIFLALATFKVNEHPRFSFGAAGLLCWVASTLW
jgi:hypothetical protein